ncbi:MAG: pentapeptide repeat-containing protein, partial [Pseudomonadota bacterium]
QLQGAYLGEAQLQRANLVEAQLQGAYLGEAQLQGAYLGEAQLQGAGLSFSQLIGIMDTPMSLDQTNLSAVTNDGGALRFVDLSGARFDHRTNFRNAFLDASVEVPRAFELSNRRPCQWAWARAGNGGDPLTDSQFYAFWLGWLLTNPDRTERDVRLIWRGITPEERHDIDPVSPPPGCVWHPD